MHIVIHIAVHQQQVAFQIRHQRSVGFIGEVIRPSHAVAPHESLVLLGPVNVVAAVVVIASA